MRRYALLLCLFSFWVLASCEPKAKPEEVFAEYIEDWRQGRYERMYELLAEPVRAELSKEQFVTRYRSIYEGIGMSRLEITPAPIDESQTAGGPLDKRSYPYRVEMDTVAGPIAFEGTVPISKSKETNHEWKVDWSPSLLFPSMEEGDRVFVRRLKAERGTIYDGFDRELAANGTVEVLGIVPGQLGEDRERTIAALAEKVAIPETVINDKLSAPWVEDELFVPIVNMTVERLKHDYSELKGVTIREESARVYPYGEAAAHLTGYIRPVTAEDLEKHAGRYEPNDMIGKAGLEHIYEQRLRGRDGVEIAIVQADGQRRETLAIVEATPGEDIRLTIDAELQRSMYYSFEGDAGTAAAVHPKSGEIFALVSSPAYDPNLFITGLSSEQWTSWNEDPKKPLLNRFTSLYVPGSVFKPITAAVGLKLGVSAVDETKAIDGLRWTKDESWGNYYVKRVRDVPVESLTDAIVNSDNIYLAQEALEIGAERFSREASMFGFDRPLPIPYPFPEASLSNDGIDDEILLADSAYGQGEVLMSSLHVALAYTPFVNNGIMVKPVLEYSDDGPALGEAWGEPILDSETAAAMNRMLLEVVEHPAGTGHRASIEGRRIAGKTGTAELKKSKGEAGQENGWFVAYEAERGELLLAAMIEDVRNRGGSAHVVRKTAKVLKEYFHGRE
ncbi:penicillin-binding transpeptidase domain-containing protein [Paenibacillus antri]|uniref:Penicillin-binding transpeptidase domain-containing protein n=1 Tax=Paenibacillus antri TaxID=2582848 RepID=A0A5R9G695_9BACL|nr:penicillin-binding transpeptidase domain-containing protein [Paenibacillus antri]TLS51902.1 penicillin-binding transpeptidase domain-containing protein [Paenibacillus antri]